MSATEERERQLTDAEDSGMQSRPLTPEVPEEDDVGAASHDGQCVPRCHNSPLIDDDEFQQNAAQGGTAGSLTDTGSLVQLSAEEREGTSVSLPRSRITEP